jgi:hypothetical protein
VKKHINKMKSQYKAKVDHKRRYKEFHIGYEVMVHLRKERFLAGTYKKLNMMKFGPCKILKKHHSGNAYEVELLSEIHVSPMFNIFDLTEYHEGDKENELRKEQWNIPTLQ